MTHSMHHDDNSRIHVVRKEGPHLSPLQINRSMCYSKHTRHGSLSSRKKKINDRTVSVLLIFSKNRTMPVHAGTQCWILDGAPPFLTFALPCIAAPLKKHAPKYSFTHASADEGHENTEQIAPQGRIPSFFQRCYLHLFACGWTCKSDPRLNQPESGNLGHQQDAKFANRVPCAQ
jgi:hypothetical protein